ncbi:plasmolipin isoform X2 [Patella vulgata]|uniref:plasmolipin isoform X2 n=1 Tax=Patella vulgata TaxID=6465 RepID=UPI00217F5599|nr:plasmolipin isoform X2 [Patella vulgata]
MTTTYEQTTVTQTTSAGVAPEIRPDVNYVKSIPGLLKIAEMVLSIIVLICSSIVYWSHLGGGWVQFVAATALITTIILFILHFMHIIHRLPGPWVFIVFIYYIVITVCWLIAAVVSAARFGYHSSIGATCFFAFVATAVFAIDTFFNYRGWQVVQHPAGSSTTANTTTTTSSTAYETRTQY